MLAGALASAAEGGPAPADSALQQLGGILFLLILGSPSLLLAWSLHTGRPWSRHLMLVMSAAPLLIGASAGTGALGVPAVVVGAAFWVLYVHRPVDDWYRLLQAREHEACLDREGRRAKRRSPA